MKHMDEQTHRDIVGLIEAEFREAMKARAYTNSPERLAAVIESRMGFETPKKSCLPEASQAPWRLDDHWFIVDKHGRAVAEIYGTNSESTANAKLIATATKLAEAACEVVMSLGTDERILVATCGELKEVLREAGAEI